MSKIPEGYGLVTPKSKANATLLLEAAQNIGVDVGLIRTSTDGYTAPLDVIDEYNRLVADLPVVEPEDADGNPLSREDLEEMGAFDAADGTINEGTLDGSNLRGGNFDDDEGVSDSADEQSAAASVPASDAQPSSDSLDEEQAITGAEQAGAGSQTVADKDAPEANEDDDEIVLPDPKSDTHEEIDDFATTHKITYDGIEASNPAKPTRAEKVAHIAAALKNKGD